MGTAERRLEIMKLLCKERYMKMIDLAEMFSVSVRTIQRDIEELTFIIPLYAKSGRYDGGVYVKEGSASETASGQGTGGERPSIPEGFIAVRVETGIINDNYVEIISGLSEGDEVYIDPSAGTTSMGMFQMGGFSGGMQMGGFPSGGGMPSSGGFPSGGMGGNRGGSMGGRP